MNKIDISNLKGVPGTLLIPLMGRAIESQKKDGILTDQKSVQIFSQIDYDFNKISNGSLRPNLFRTVVRTKIMDQLVASYINNHPSATIVEIGCGLNTRFERLDNGKITWFDLDVPQVYRIWQSFFTTTNRRRFLPTSAFDESWMSQVKKTSKKSYLFISEASIPYFPVEQVKTLFCNLHKFFPGSHYLFDSASPGFLAGQRDNSIARKHYNTHFQWFLGNNTSLKKWIPTLKILQTIDLERPSQPFSSFYPKHFIPNDHGAQLNFVQL